MKLGNAIFCGNDISYFYGDYYKTIFKIILNFRLNFLDVFNLLQIQNTFFGTGICSLLF